MITCNREKICVVTVTYGARLHLLQEVLHALGDAVIKVDRVIVVDNGATGCLNDLVFEGGTIDIVRMGRNSGSAAGFKAGLQRALETDYDLVWLLDDDNVPEPGALAALLDARESLNNDEKHIFAALRLDREKYVLAASTDYNLNIEVNSYLGFNLLDVPKKLWRRVAGVPRPRAECSAVAGVKPLSYGIYGGLLIHRMWLDKIGLPDERFYLYMDDAEYTSRLVQNGARIFLVPGSRIKDIDDTWGQKKVKKLPLVLDTGADNMKLYYTLRNSCFLTRDRFVDNRFLFYLNMVSFFIFMFVWGIFSGNSARSLWKRFRLVIRASLDGINGKLGYRENIPEVTK